MRRRDDGSNTKGRSDRNDRKQLHSSNRPSKVSPAWKLLLISFALIVASAVAFVPLLLLLGTSHTNSLSSELAPGSTATGSTKTSEALPPSLRAASKQHAMHQTPRIAIQTVMIGQSYEVTLSNHKSYCDKWGYHHSVVTENSRPERKPQWEKIPAMLRLFDMGYDYVMQVDSDAFFANCTISLQPFVDRMVREGSSWLFAGDYNIVINTGQFIFRNTDAALGILRTVDNIWYSLRFGNKGLQDNKAFAAYLGGATVESSEEEVETAFERCRGCNKTNTDQCRFVEHGSRQALSFVSNELLQHISFVRQRDINAYDGNYQEGDFIYHCAGRIPKPACFFFDDHENIPNTCFGTRKFQRSSRIIGGGLIRKGKPRGIVA
mmetsp:Transcript_22932/g.49710  ORF Transcript_22932/g.49710 Transcript_22932/m.49710 type:complete len:378 (+) Transcript_22932:18-1151(+)